MDAAKSIFISAGEQSGDLHGSFLMHEMNKLKELKYTGLGGDLMAAEGLSPIAHIRDLAATGIAEVARKYVYFKSILKKCAHTILESNPSAVILIDFPGFNLRLAEEIRESYNGKIVYYISPQVWAWHEKRALKIKKLIDKMLVVFPFEVEFYKRYGIEAEYVGHPLVKRIGEFLKGRVKPTSAEIKKITILPGSRNDEVKHHLPVLLETVNLLRKEFRVELTISKAPAIDAGFFNTLLEGEKDYKLADTELYKNIFESDLVMTKAGTSTMECSLIGTPFLIFYKTYRINYFILKPLVKINSIGIINIITGKNTVKEFVQKDFTAVNLYRESKHILTDDNYRLNLIDELKKVWEILGDGNASLNARFRNQSIRPGMKFITIPLSYLFRIIVFFRNKLYDNGYIKQKQLDCIVISVGNLSAGGTGKTPLVEFIANYLLEKGKFVAILLKGYKREHDDIKVIELGYDNSRHHLNTETVGDEAFLFLNNISKHEGRGLIVVGDDKTSAAKFAYAKFKPEVMIIDDGFQHRKLERDLDILLIDGNEGKYLFPAGKLREPFRNKSRADLVVINEKFDGPKLMERIGNTISVISYYEFENFYNTNNEPFALEGTNAVAFCGIGDPESFRGLLVSKNVNLLKFLKFPDHHDYSIDDIKKIISEFEISKAGSIITTQKDFLRINNSEIVLGSSTDNVFKQLLFKNPLYYTKIKTSFRKNSEALYSHLDKVVKLV